MTIISITAYSCQRFDRKYSCEVWEIVENFRDAGCFHITCAYVWICFYYIFYIFSYYMCLCLDFFFIIFFIYFHITCIWAILLILLCSVYSKVFREEENIYF